MKKVAIVVQRCHESIVGGSESLAWQYANLLKDFYQIELLTTTATDIFDWANSLPAGNEIIDDIVIRRFPVTLGRTPFWGKLHERLLRDFQLQGPEDQILSKGDRLLRWPLSFQEEFIRTQGPYSESLLEFLSEHWSVYQTIIFVTYLYPTSYFGLLQVPRNFALFAPTLHDEEPAYLSAYKHAAQRARSLIWLTPAEQRLGRELWGELSGRVVGMQIDTRLRPPARLNQPCLLYCGRVDSNKGCPQLFDYFMRFKSEHPSDLRLVIAGKDDIPVPDHRDIDFRGFVSAEEKFSLMAGATVLVMPSARESFSIVTLEAMAQGTPVLASGGSKVLADHIRHSGAGRTYADYQTFASSLNEILSEHTQLASMGSAGRDYVLSQYQPEQISEALIPVIESRV
jgi:glycosyltransferase involved in cell wall biosynthesis